MCADRGVNSAKPLFSHTRTSGSRQSVARFTVSVKTPPWTAPSPKKTTATESSPRSTSREGAPQGDRDVAADDAGRAHEAVLRVDEVHRASETAAQTCVATEQLGQQPVERRALGDRVPVCPVAGVHRVVVAQLAAHRSRDSLAADAQMDQSLDLARPYEHADLLLEEADSPHRRKQAFGLRGVH